MPQKKNNFRKQIKTQRKRLSKEDLKHSSEGIIEQLNKNCKWDQMMVNMFLPIKKFNEPDLRLLKTTINNHGGQVCINRSDFNGLEMTPVLWNEKLSIEESEFGIPEPIDGTEVSITAIDIVLVPLLAFNKDGHRLGYGKGFYDRFLAKTNKNCLFIGINHDGDSVEFGSVQEHDIKLHHLAAPNTFLNFL